MKHISRQPSLFKQPAAPAGVPSDEAPWCVAVKQPDGRYYAVSLNHRYLTEEAAAQAALEEQHLWMGKLEARLVARLGEP